DGAHARDHRAHSDGNARVPRALPPQQHLAAESGLFHKSERIDARDYCDKVPGSSVQTPQMASVLAILHS
ncbi:hypothetical protein H9Q72_014627, partial [Fusarium xylarioides]